MARFRAGLHAAAMPDLAKALRQEPRNVDAMLWLYLAETRSGLEGRQRLSRTVGRVADRTGWPEAVVALYLGQAGEGRVRAQAENGDETARRRQQTEANFYVGQHALVNGDSAAAAAHFRAAVAIDLKTLPAYLAAKAELRNIGS